MPSMSCWPLMCENVSPQSNLKATSNMKGVSIRMNRKGKCEVLKGVAFTRMLKMSSSSIYASWYLTLTSRSPLILLKCHIYIWAPVKYFAIFSPPVLGKEAETEELGLYRPDMLKELLIIFSLKSLVAVSSSRVISLCCSVLNPILNNSLSADSIKLP